MHRALLALALARCVTTAGAVKRDDGVELPLLGGAVADLVVSSLAASQIQGNSAGASLVTGLALPAVDVAAGCPIGAPRKSRVFERRFRTGCRRLRRQTDRKQTWRRADEVGLVRHVLRP